MAIKIFRIILFLLMLNVCPWAGAAVISVSVDRNPVAVDESFQILFESNESVDDDPDFSPLARDFTILSTGRSSNTSIVNGKVTRSSQWILTVMAKKTGTLSIPAVRFGKDRSQPGTVSVMATGGRASHNSGDIFLEVEVTPDDPYVQAQVIYTVRLYRSVVTDNGSLSEPQPSGGNAVIERLGEDKSYEVQKVGVRYMVTERQYAIFPQGSGDITIEPVTFQGQIGRDTGFFMDPFGPPPRMVVEKSRAVQLHVKPISQGFTGKLWLPLRKLELQEQWSRDPSALPAGEPVTRTLKLIAEGLTASQLPDMEDALPDTLKQYPDQPVQNNNIGSQGITGTREEKTAVIPAQEGEYPLPAIEIPWWNTKTDRQEVAILPARIITVLPAVTAKGKSPGVTTEPRIDVTTEDAQAPSSVQLAPGSGTPAGNEYWKWISMLLAAGWLISLLLWWKIGGRHHEGMAKTEKQENRKHVINGLKRACQGNDPVAAKDCILKWAGIIWPESTPASLGQLEKRYTGRFSEQLCILSQTLYSARQQDWNGSEFFQAFEAVKQDAGKTEKEKAGGLEPLYKL